MPVTFAQAMRCTQPDWPYTHVMEFFGWSRQGNSVRCPEPGEDLTYNEAYMFWAYDLCNRLCGWNGLQAKAVWTLIRDTIKQQLTVWEETPAGGNRPVLMLLVAEDRWVFCTGGEQSLDLQTCKFCDLPIGSVMIKSTAYNLENLFQRRVRACIHLDPLTGDDPNADPSTASPATPAPLE